MYDKRIKIFVILSALFMMVCLLRLGQMQLLTASSVQNEIAELKRQRGKSQQLKTIRGKILDRKGNVLAVDEVKFWLHINYRLTSLLDERVQQAKLLQAAKEPEPYTAISETGEEIRTRLENLQRIIEKCTHFGLERKDIEEKIASINNKIWNLRTFIAWSRNGPDPKIIERYDRVSNVPLYEATADLEKKCPDKNQRLMLANKVDDIPEIDNSNSLLELKTDDDIFAAQLEFLEADGVQILPQEHRFYPYSSVAAQIIGWVGPATQEQDKELFVNDRLASYLGGDLCGREDGVEYVCETILRGRRGELIHDIDKQLVSRTETKFGKDISLTLDIELQQRIENYLTEYKHDPSCRPGMAAVIIEVGTGDILAMVSLPVFDLNRVRYEWGTLIADDNKPLINRAINEQYPPGSVIKPLILIAGLETGKVTPDEIISCPAQEAPKSWPSCWLYNRYKAGHDGKWENKARNAIKGSCNIYFSRLCDRIEPENLQQWLFKFGYGHNVLSPPAYFPKIARAELNRNFNQLSGTISSSVPRGNVLSFEDVPPLQKSERRWFGIGQGNLRVTPLQVANAMAAIARGGMYKPPRLFLDYRETNNNQESAERRPVESIELGVSAGTLAVICDGMSAVVNENGGTAYSVFAPALKNLAQQDVKVYGKTGSTEDPDHAWFAGFAQDSTARKLAIAVVVEGGQHGSSDAAPLARDIIQFCIEAEYIGKTTPAAE